MVSVTIRPFMHWESGGQLKNRGSLPEQLTLSLAWNQGCITTQGSADSWTW